MLSDLLWLERLFKSNDEYWSFLLWYVAWMNRNFRCWIYFLFLKTSVAQLKTCMIWYLIRCINCVFEYSARHWHWRFRSILFVVWLNFLIWKNNSNRLLICVCSRRNIFLLRFRLFSSNLSILIEMCLLKNDEWSSYVCFFKTFESLKYRISLWRNFSDMKSLLNLLTCAHCIAI